MGLPLQGLPESVNAVHLNLPILLVVGFLPDSFVGPGLPVGLWLFRNGFWPDSFVGPGLPVGLRLFRTGFWPDSFVGPGLPVGLRLVRNGFLPALVDVCDVGVWPLFFVTRLFVSVVVCLCLLFFVVARVCPGRERTQFPLVDTARGVDGRCLLVDDVFLDPPWRENDTPVSIGTDHEGDTGSVSTDGTERGSPWSVGGVWLCTRTHGIFPSNEIPSPPAVPVTGACCRLGDGGGTRTLPVVAVPSEAWSADGKMSFRDNGITRVLLGTLDGARAERSGGGVWSADG